MISERRWRNSGFSLLELLVVIAVIGILVSVGAASYTQAQRKARDTRRIQDIKAMQSALEQYFSNNDAYPIGCATTDLDDSYLPAGIPRDPQNVDYDIDCPAADSYCVCGDLEGDRGNSSDNACSFVSTGDGDYYCATNLQ